MKKAIVIFILIFSSFAIAKEETPLLLDSPVTVIDYTIDDSTLINYDKMKKSQKIKEVQSELDKTKKPEIRLNTTQINHQRALDYTTKYTNTMMLPTF